MDTWCDSATKKKILSQYTKGSHYTVCRVVPDPIEQLIRGDL